MNRRLLFKGLIVWLCIIPLAIVNAGVRENVLAPVLGEGLALPLSGIILSALILLGAWFAIPWFGSHPARVFGWIGVQWLLLTLAFELVLGRYLLGRSWSELIQVFNVLQGNLFLLAVLGCLVAPYLGARVRGQVISGSRAMLPPRARPGPPVATRTSNLFDPRPPGETDEQFIPLVETPAFRLEHIVSHGQATPPGEWYDQPRPEWVLLVRGRATLHFEEGGDRELQAGDHLLIPARWRHRVEACSSDAVWMALHFSDS